MLKVMFAPFLPFTSEKLHAILGYDKPLFGNQFDQTVTDSLGEHKVLRYDGSTASGKWEAGHLKPGAAFNAPAPLFKKLDIKIVEEERSKLGVKPE
jgi:methionyl-tRNA synthetase